MRAIFIFLLLFCSCTSDKKQLNLFVWGEYISPQVIDRFEKEYDCHVHIDTYETNEAMYAKLKLGATGYDLIMPSNYIFETMVQQDMLHLLDQDNIPNQRFFKSEKAKRLGLQENLYGFPVIITYTGIGYQKERVPDFVPSWMIFGRPDLRGRVTLLNDMREALGAALLTLGYSINTHDPEQISEAVDLLLIWKRNIAKFESEQYKSGLASQEFLAVQGYNTDILQVMEEEPTVGFAFPEEGVAFSVDYLAIPKGAPHTELAEAFINFMLQPDIATLNVNISLSDGFVELNEVLLKPYLRHNPTFFPPPHIQKKSQLIRNVGKDLDLYHAAWERVLSE